jgi:hypothetical protein
MVEQGAIMESGREGRKWEERKRWKGFYVTGNSRVLVGS